MTRRGSNILFGLVFFWFLTVGYNVAWVPFPFDPLVVGALEMGLGAPWVVWAVAVLGMTTAAGLGWLGGRTLAPWVLRQKVAKRKAFGRAQVALQRRGGLAVVLSAVTPLPFSVVCWAAGVAQVPVARVLLAAALSRAVRLGVVVWGWVGVS